MVENFSVYKKLSLPIPSPESENTQDLKSNSLITNFILGKSI